MEVNSMYYNDEDYGYFNEGLGGSIKGFGRGLIGGARKKAGAAYGYVRGNKDGIHRARAIPGAVAGLGGGLYGGVTGAIGGAIDGWDNSWSDEPRISSPKHRAKKKAKSIARVVKKKRR